MNLKVHYLVSTEQCISYGYCNYEIIGDYNEEIITEIPMDEFSNNLPRENLKLDKKDKKLKVK